MKSGGCFNWEFAGRFFVSMADVNLLLSIQSISAMFVDVQKKWNRYNITSVFFFYQQQKSIDYLKKIFQKKKNKKFEYLSSTLNICVLFHQARLLMFQRLKSSLED